MPPLRSESQPLLPVKPVNILLVDDEPRNLEVLEGILAAPEYRLVRAGGAREALLALLQEEFALLVLDIQMPGVSGLELASLVKSRARTQHVPIIFLTAFYEDEKRMLEGYHAGAVDYLTKPVNPFVLRSKVAVFVDLHRKNAALAQEIHQRQLAEAALRDANDALEERVARRTAELRAARDAAERAGRAKDDFLAALSHELRTPLNPVLLIASDAAENPELPAEVRAQFATIRKNVELEARLIDDLLDLTRITRGKLPLDTRRHDFHGIVADALDTVRGEIAQKSIDLRLDLAAPEANVDADHVRLQQVCWNLLRNAVKFTPAAGTVTVRTRLVSSDPPRIEFAVADTGIGLSPAEIERIFEAFAQGDHATGGGAHRFGGLGLGLTISRSLVELHGGTLRAESAGPGRGATFFVELPLASTGVDGEAETGAGDGMGAAPVMTAGKPAGSAESAVRETRGETSSPGETTRSLETGPASDSAGPGPATRAGTTLAACAAGATSSTPPRTAASRLRRVLLVEDHEPTRKTLEILLRRRRFEVTSSGSVEGAKDLAGRQEFDLLISDIGLPDGTGFELMTELKGRGLRGIALTGYGMEEDIDRSRHAGFHQHLTKPVRVQLLDRALAALSEG